METIKLYVNLGEGHKFVAVADSVFEMSMKLGTVGTNDLQVLQDSFKEKYGGTLTTQDKVSDSEREDYTEYHV